MTTPGARYAQTAAESRLSSRAIDGAYQGLNRAAASAVARVGGCRARADSCLQVQFHSAASGPWTVAGACCSAVSS